LERRVIQLTAQMRIWVAVASIDFRAGIDGLARVCRAQLGADPFGGGLFVFCNRRRTACYVRRYRRSNPASLPEYFQGLRRLHLPGSPGRAL
jgi:hypothetical protein